MDIGKGNFLEIKNKFLARRLVIGLPEAEYLVTTKWDLTAKSYF